MLCFVLVLAAIVLLYLLCLRPNTSRREQMAPFARQYIAHRGLFDVSAQRPENSMAAFRAAIEHGYGIELDVQLTADNVLVVFHDESLDRMCGVKRRICDCTLAELRQYSLQNTREQIPLFQDVLALVAGRAPLIVEIKYHAGKHIQNAAAAAAMLDDYRGLYCIESFHPMVVNWFRKHRPAVLRGQLSCRCGQEAAERRAIERFVLTNLLLNGLTRPDFIAYHHKHADQFSYRLCRKLYHVVNAAWTIRSQKQLERAKKWAQIIIFDSFIPEK